MSYKTIQLKRGKEESLDRFHPWVFSGAIQHLPDGVEEGEIVKVKASDGRIVGVGHYQIGSIAVRMLEWGDTVIDSEFYRSRLEAAFGLRRALKLQRADNNAFRLVHGEGDFLPGLVVDVYGDTAVVQAHSPGMHFAREVIANALVSIDGLGVKNVYYKSETTLPYKAHLDPQNTYLIGKADTDIARAVSYTHLTLPAHARV